MTTKTGIKCDYCGRFISFKDLESGMATHQMIFPDSEWSTETYETECAECAGKDKEPHE